VDLETVKGIRWGETRRFFHTEYGATWEGCYCQTDDRTVRSSELQGICWAVTCEWVRAQLTQAKYDAGVPYPLAPLEQPLTAFRQTLLQKNTQALVEKQRRYQKYIIHSFPIREKRWEKCDNLDRRASTDKDIHARQEWMFCIKRFNCLDPLFLLSDLIIQPLGEPVEDRLAGNYYITYDSHLDLAEKVVRLLPSDLFKLPRHALEVFMLELYPKESGDHVVGLVLTNEGGRLLWGIFDANLGEQSELPLERMTEILPKYFTEIYDPIDNRLYPGAFRLIRILGLRH
jgi:hypothetical protein